MQNNPRREARSEAISCGTSIRAVAPHQADFAQPLYSSWRLHQGPVPVSLRPLGPRSSHWYMPHSASSPRA